MNGFISEFLSLDKFYYEFEGYGAKYATFENLFWAEKLVIRVWCNWIELPP